jgi:O-antigen/teichoic acid export membrane protein
MGKQKSIKLNYLMNCMLTVSSMIFPLISYPYVSRILQPEGMGKVAFANSIIAYFAMAAMMGIPTYGIRACARVRDDKRVLSKTVWELLSLNLLMTILVYAFFGAALLCVPRMAADKPLFAVMSISILFQMLGVEWLFKAMEEYTYITVRSVLFKLVALLLMFICIHNQSDYVRYGALTMFAGVGSNLCNLLRMRHLIEPYARCFPKEPGHRTSALSAVRHFVQKAWKKHMKSITVFFAMTAATTIYTNLDVAMLGFMSGDIEAGYYSAAVKIKGVLVSFVTALGSVMLPRMSYYVEQKMKKEFNSMLRRAFLFVGMVSVPLCIFFIFFAKYSILILSGEAFLPAVRPMQIIMPTLILIGFSNICGIQILVPLGMEKQVLYSEIAGAITDICINLWLIPGMGAEGAAIGTVVAETVVLLYQIYAMIRLKRRENHDTGKNQTV